ncbi:hypothetical protein B0T26DRAFT_237675 [Lasiosphaeria miniovina]|uniref:Uncharacterized protein n=1 Tax=Lasiosphaeria miniovina TaxID=1954250 RepID=A0AA40E3M5_9PEZI|nr:uncharacterized protein B0T26DRAFT_237675 [Lasiosphaeria miniovina]KAK0722856.1 hypothetical protein B0T26DRAFT_237675 [Lasiosphaeria miniovina]
MALGSRTEQPSTDTEPCSVIQLELEGSTILEAWNGNQTTRAMEQLANSYERGADPSNFSFRALPVYHGTDALRGIPTFEMQATVRYGLLYGSVAANQVASPSPCLPVLWTGFSPLRCFLWAAFKGDVLQLVPNATVGNKLKMPWKCGDHEHVGILVFKFQPALPSALGEASYIIPPRLEQEWSSQPQVLERVTRKGATPGDCGGYSRLFTTILNQPGPRHSTVGSMAHRGQCCHHISNNSGERFGSALGSRHCELHIKRHTRSLLRRDQKRHRPTRILRPKSTGLRLRGLWDGAYARLFRWQISRNINRWRR